MENQETTLFSIGELAEKAGVTVRTLQYYDKTGLLKSKPSEGGRRMYTLEDIFKLQQILFFKSCGFSLEEIKDKIMKFKSASDLEEIFTEQRAILSGQIENLMKITKMLDTVIFETKKGKDVSIDKLMTIMYLMKQGNPYTFVLSYFGSEQLKSIAERFQTSLEKSQSFIESAQEVFAELNSLYQQGAAPASPEGQKLAKRWWDMVMDFTGGDPGLLKTLISAGMDIGDWPDETREFREAIEHFLGEALNIYLSGKGINLSEFGVSHDE